MERLAAVFFCIGALDFLTGSRLHLGEAFRRAFGTLPGLFITMTGFMCLAPWISGVAAPAVGPLMTMIGCDPSFFAGLLISCDSGAAVLAREMALDPEAGLYNGMIVASYLGVTISFTIPYALMNSSDVNRGAVVRGLLVGFVTIPLGCVISGVLGGFPAGVILSGLLPIIAMCVLLILLFRISPAAAQKVFLLISYIVRGVSLFGFSAVVLKEYAGISLVGNMTPLDEVLPVIGRIAVFLAGILPAVELLRLVLKKGFDTAASILKIDAEGVNALVTSAVNSMPVIFDLAAYEPRSAMLNTAFFTSACFAVGDFLAFAMQFSPRTALPLMAGKLAAGGIALAAAAAWGPGPSADPSSGV